MRSPTRIVPLALAALIVALAGLWSAPAAAHPGHHAARIHCLDHAPIATSPHATQFVAQLVTAAATDTLAESHGASCPSGCCTGGASCASPIAGPPADAIGLGDPGRPRFGETRERALATSPGERLPKPPRG